jgi:hypothetical protein
MNCNNLQEYMDPKRIKLVSNLVYDIARNFVLCTDQLMLLG